MLVHSVFFYLREDLTPAQIEEFRRDGLESLRAIESITTFYVGRPAVMTPRPVVDSTYSFGLTCVFKDIAAHDHYQVHKIHTDFVARFKSYWTRVQIYDAA